MIHAVLATATAGIHLLFIAFVVFGGLAVVRWPRLAWLHIPAVLWGAFVEIAGQVCPLTDLENHFRQLAVGAGYDVSFIEHYLLALIYPELLLGRPLPSSVFIAIGIAVLALNGAVYWRLWRHQRNR